MAVYDVISIGKCIPNSYSKPAGEHPIYIEAQSFVKRKKLTSRHLKIEMKWFVFIIQIYKILEACVVKVLISFGSQLSNSLKSKTKIIAFAQSRHFKSKRPIAID